MRPHLDRDDIIHDQAYNFAYHQKLESFRYNAFLAITSTISGSFREKHYQQLCLDLLQLRRWYRELCYSVKICNSKSSDYFLIPTLNRSQQTKNVHNALQFKVKHNYSKTHVIDKNAKWLLISRYDINQIFYSILYLILLSWRYLPECAF